MLWEFTAGPFPRKELWGQRGLTSRLHSSSGLSYCAELRAYSSVIFHLSRKSAYAGEPSTSPETLQWGIDWRYPTGGIGDTLHCRRALLHSTGTAGAYTSMGHYTAACTAGGHYIHSTVSKEGTQKAELKTHFRLPHDRFRLETT